MFLKSILYAALAIGSATMGQHLITATQRFIAGEMALANINPYATSQAQNAQISSALAQVNQAPQP